MAKRKREVAVDDVKQKQPQSPAPKKPTSSSSNAAIPLTAASSSSSGPVTLQIVTGSYERVLHGITATIPHLSTADIPNASAPEVKFSDTFLFSAHASAIRCLALSPVATSDPKQKVLLASGGTDERINLYHLSATPPPSTSSQRKGGVSIPSLTGTTVLENPKNRELGSLLHHSSSISALYFPSRSKLLSAAEDSTIAISRTRDWTVLSTIKAPVPKPQGRPSGDTAGPGEIPAGVNDFSVHPSMKLMVSVSKGERCMRLWNLVTGKKAGVLNFTREMLQEAGEGRFSSGEGRRVEWDTNGEEFVVGFERGAIVFGMDSQPKGRIIPQPPSKIHQIRYVSLGSKTTTTSESDEEESTNNVLAISTEDGRIIFYSTSTLLPPQSSTSSTSSKPAPTIPLCKPLAQLGGRAAGVSGRIKDFEILTLNSPSSDTDGEAKFLIVTASSTGAVRLWYLPFADLETQSDQDLDADADVAAETTPKSKSKKNKHEDANARTPTIPASAAPASSAAQPDIKQVGNPLGVYDTGNRITCLKAFVMLAPQPEADGNDDDEEEGAEEEESSESSDDE